MDAELNGDSSNGLCNVQISIDGTWMKRGFSSLYGCVFVISEETGNVLDLFSASIVNLVKYGRKEISQRKNTRNGKQI